MSGTVAEPAQAAPSVTAVHGRCIVLAGIFAFALAGAAAEDAVALLAVTALTQAALILALVYGSGMPGRIGGLLLGAVAAGGADVAVSVYPHRELAPLLVVLGLAVAAMFVHQLTRGVVRVRTTESLSKIALLVVAVTALPSIIQLRHDFDGATLASGTVLAVCVALVTGHAVDIAWPRPHFDPAVPRGLTGLAAGALVAGAAGLWTFHGVEEFSTVHALWVSAAIGAVTGFLAIAAAFAVHGPPEALADTAAGPAPREGVAGLLPVVQVLLPLALVAPVAYLICLAGQG